MIEQTVWDGRCDDCGETCVKLDVGNAGNYLGYFCPVCEPEMFYATN